MLTNVAAQPQNPTNFNPKIDTKSICDGTLVNKTKLAEVLIGQFGLGGIAIRIDSLRRANPPPPEFARRGNLPLWQVIMGTRDVCENAALHCSPAERDAADSMLTYTESVILGGRLPGVHAPATRVRSDVYFLSPSNQYVLNCEPSPAETVSAPSGGGKSTAPSWAFDWKDFRIRGFPEQVVYPHPSNAAVSTQYDASDLFNSSDGASINFKYDGIQKSRSDSLIGTIGYDFNLRKNTVDISRTDWPFLDLVPYAAVDRELTNKLAGNPPRPASSFSAELVHLGIAGSAAAWSNMPHQEFGLVTHVFVVRPDYLLNLQDQSRLLTGNLRYIPVFNRGVNSYYSLIEDILRGYVIIDGRTNLGVYTEKGNTVGPLNTNFVRLGGRVGGALTYTGIPNYPVDAWITYTDFLAAAGFNHGLGELQANATFNFGPDKLLGVTASYRNGRREDNAHRDEAWTVGLTVKY
jgi:hypothetical protein